MPRHPDLIAGLGLNPLTAKKKDRGRVRPLAAPNVLRRLVAGSLCAQYKSAFLADLGPIEHAIGLPVERRSSPNPSKPTSNAGPHSISALSRSTALRPSTAKNARMHSPPSKRASLPSYPSRPSSTTAEASTSHGTRTASPSPSKPTSAGTRVIPSPRWGSPMGSDPPSARPWPTSPKPSASQTGPPVPGRRPGVVVP